ncbi:hypothetical protein NON20_16780 [Synechocystis sp. B12]|nr:hypothetical protein NON20_16780 [Synechocystis sp. B12]
MGNISTGSIVTSPFGGNAGNVILNAGGTLTTGYIETSGTNGGDVTTSSGSNTSTAYIDTRGFGDGLEIDSLGELFLSKARETLPPPLLIPELTQLNPSMKVREEMFSSQQMAVSQRITYSPLEKMVVIFSFKLVKA